MKARLLSLSFLIAFFGASITMAQADSICTWACKCNSAGCSSQGGSWPVEAPTLSEAQQSCSNSYGRTAFIDQSVKAVCKQFPPSPISCSGDLPPNVDPKIPLGQQNPMPGPIKGQVHSLILSHACVTGGGRGKKATKLDCTMTDHGQPQPPTPPWRTKDTTACNNDPTTNNHCWNTRFVRMTESKLANGDYGYCWYFFNNDASHDRDFRLHGDF
jgi:hypothetical protein